MSLGWFKAIRSEEALELIKASPNAFIIAAVIAYRARWRDTFHHHNTLELGEAMLGDCHSYGMTEQQYRTAKQKLTDWGFATFRSTNRGTIGKLTNTRLFSVLQETINDQNNSLSSDCQRSNNEPATTNLEGKKERTSKLTTKGYEKALNDSTKLSKTQRHTSQRFEALLALQWRNDAGKWVNRIKQNPAKCERVIAELELAHKEERIKSTPAQFAEQTWKEFR